MDVYRVGPRTRLVGGRPSTGPTKAWCLCLMAQGFWSQSVPPSLAFRYCLRGSVLLGPG